MVANGSRRRLPPRFRAAASRRHRQFRGPRGREKQKN